MSMWRRLFEWDVLGVLVLGLFMASGFGLLTVDWFPHNLLVAQLFFAVSGLIVVAKVWGQALQTEGSIRSRLAYAVSISLASTGFIFVLILSVQQHKQHEANPHPSFFYISRLLDASLVFISRPWIGRIFSFATGIVLTLLFQLIAQRYKERAIRTTLRKNTPRGFLDYKLQTERAISELAVAISPISSIMGQVGRLMERGALKVEKSRLRPTKEHLRLANRLAKKLMSFSVQIDKRCDRLENVGTSFKEGLIGWFEWINRQQNKETLIAFAPSMRGLRSGLESALSGTDSYLASMEGLKDVSADLNYAIETQAKSVQRVRAATTEIWEACCTALLIAEGTEKKLL